MKKLILFGFAALALVSCKKERNGGAQSSLPVTADSYSTLTLKTSGQVVKMNVTTNVLKLVYNEDVTLILDSNSLKQAWSVHLKEDFTGTQLANFDYNSLTKYGVDATNWVDDNLSNIKVLSSKDTLINSRMFVKKRITRSFNYQKTYNTSADANAELNQLLKQIDIMTFTAYYSPQDPSVAAKVNTAKLTYVRL